MWSITEPKTPSIPSECFGHSSSIELEYINTINVQLKICANQMKEKNKTNNLKVHN